MKRCPRCDFRSADDVEMCPRDGASLVDADTDDAPPLRAGHYRILGTLGRGGIGSVYLAEDPRLERRVAIKVLNRSFVGDSTVLPRFQAEARTMARIRHPNVCAIYDLGETEDGLPYLAMEYVEGRTLGQILAVERRMTPARAGSIALQISRGLQAAHDLGIIHRDLKPSNVMVSPGPDGTELVRLLDFGIAKLAEQADQGLTRTGLTIGTPAYMSPEQLAADRVTVASDIYALGLVYFEMITGALPFRSASQLSMLHARLTERPARVSEILPGSALQATEVVLERALAREPVDRYGTAGDFGEAVMKALQSDLGGAEAAARSRARSGPRSAVTAWLRRWFSTGASGSGSPASSEPVTAERTIARPGAESDERTLQEVAPSGPVPPPVGPAEEVADARWPGTPPGADDRDDRTRMMTRTTWTPQPQPAAATAEGVEFTRIFPSPNAPSADADLPVALTVTASRDARLVGTRVVCRRFPFVIGRAHDADLSIASDLMLSRRHVEIDRDGNGFLVRDLSTNGIYVGGRLMRGGVEPLFFGTPIFLSKSTAIALVADIPTLPDLSGALIHARLRLERRLHDSVKAATYLAHDVRVPRRALAIKIFSPRLMRLTHYRQQFERQATLAAALKHPHICKVLEFGEFTAGGEDGAGSLSYVCMEYMEGGSLADRMDTPPLPEMERVVHWVQCLAAALHHAHRNDIVHGDLKPGCVVFDSDGTIYLTDFALARNRDSPAGTVVVGSPGFLAPEQWNSLPSSQATDQYALAALAYLMVTGSKPYEGQSDPDVRRRNLARGPVPAHEEAAAAGRTRVSPAVSDVLARGMAVEPEQRYGSVLDFSEAFARAVSQPERAGSKPRVFMSYQRQASAAWAILFARVLEEKHDYSVFVDTQARDGSPVIPDRIRNEIATCDAFVCLLAPGTLTSAWVRQEIEIAREHGKPMVPVFHEEFRPKDEEDAAAPAVRTLLSFDAVHLLDRRNIYVDTTIAELATRLSRLL